MNILCLNAYFTPEIVSISAIEKDLILGLVEAGHSLQIITPTPSRGIDKESYKKYKKIKNEKLYDGRVIVRRFACPREKKNPIIRAIRYFWCNFREYQIAKRYKDVDVVFAFSTPPTQGLLGTKVAKKLSKKLKKKIPFIYNLQDIFPDSLVTTGLSKKNSLLWKIGRAIEDKTYRNCDRIITISESMKQNILDKGVPEQKISVISNWIDVNNVHPVAKDDNKLYEEFGIAKDKFLVVYAGNFGKAQGAHVLLDVANLLSDNHDVQFVIFGGGSEFDSVKEEASNMQNVIINPLLPADRVSEVYSLGDVAVITCKKGVGNSGMPSKTWSIMACNTPIIASFDLDSDLAKTIDIANAGICVEPENATALKEAILFAKENKLKANGREYVIEHASKEKCVDRYVEEITQVTRS